MGEKTPVQLARERFDDYATRDLDAFSSAEVMQEVQARLAAWESKNFPGNTIQDRFIGAVEETGELGHAILKNAQQIRGMENEQAFREAAGDAIADTVIYLCQVATTLRLDLETLIIATAREVMKRDWNANRENGEAKPAVTHNPARCREIDCAACFDIEMEGRFGDRFGAP